MAVRLDKEAHSKKIPVSIPKEKPFLAIAQGGSKGNRLKGEGLKGGAIHEGTPLKEQGILPTRRQGEYHVTQSVQDGPDYKVVSDLNAADVRDLVILENDANGDGVSDYDLRLTVKQLHRQNDDTALNVISAHNRQFVSFEDVSGVNYHGRMRAHSSVSFVNSRDFTAYGASFFLQNSQATDITLQGTPADPMTGHFALSEHSSARIGVDPDDAAETLGVRGSVAHSEVNGSLSSGADQVTLNLAEGRLDGRAGEDTAVILLPPGSERDGLMRMRRVDDTTVEIIQSNAVRADYMSKGSHALIGGETLWTALDHYGRGWEEPLERTMKLENFEKLRVSYDGGVTFKDYDVSQLPVEKSWWDRLWGK